MAAPFRNLRSLEIGKPEHHRGVTAVALCGDWGEGAPLMPLGLALASGAAVVREHHSAAVGQLELANRSGDTWILGISGEMLRGGKQDRAINSSFLIRPLQQIPLPVSCVEQGRWSYEERFVPSHHVASSAVRQDLYQSVHTSVTRVSSRMSDQSAVWRRVDRTHSQHDVRTSSSALRRVYEVKSRKIRRRVRAFSALPNQLGLALFVGQRLTSLDLFSCQRVLAHYHDQLIAAAVADVMSGAEHSATGEEDGLVSEVLGRIDASRVWAEVKAVGDGQELMPSLPGFAVSTLCRDGRIEHLELHPSPQRLLVSAATRAQGSAIELLIRVNESPPYHVCLGPGQITIGRSSKCDLRIDEQTVSRLHAALTVGGDGVYLRDLESSNGSAVNDREVTFSRLQRGDRFILGKHVEAAVIELE